MGDILDLLAPENNPGALNNITERLDLVALKSLFDRPNPNSLRRTKDLCGYATEAESNDRSKTPSPPPE